MVTKLQRLPAAVQEAVKELACLGNIVDVATLALVRESTEAQIHSMFLDAAQAGLMIRLEGAYRFAHDRVQEAAYALIPQASRLEMHLRIGRQLRAASEMEPTAERVFAAVNQLNHAVNLIADADEKMALLRLNVLAGMKAKDGIAYSAARDYLARAAALISADAWTRHYEETLELYLALTECEYLAGDFDSADQLFDLMLGRARSDLDRARIYSLRIKVYQASSRYDDSVVLVLEALRLFGVTFPESDDEIQTAAETEFHAVTANLGGRRIADLLDAPAAEAPEVRAIIDLLVDAAPGAYNGKPELFPLVTMKAVNFSLRYGHTDQSSYAYAVHALTLVSVYGELAQAFEFSEMALQAQREIRQRPPARDTPSSSWRPCQLLAPSFRDRCSRSWNRGFAPASKSATWSTPATWPFSPSGRRSREASRSRRSHRWRRAMRSLLVRATSTPYTRRSNSSSSSSQACKEGQAIRSRSTRPDSTKRRRSPRLKRPRSAAALSSIGS